MSLPYKSDVDFERCLDLNPNPPHPQGNRSTTAADTATHIQTLLNAQFAPSCMMKGNSRLGIPSGENGFKTERVERAVCGPVVMQGSDGPGAESWSEGVEL